MAPMPNNGTLRLPLRPVGVHQSPDTGLDTPSDPDDTASSATTVSSETTASKSTKPVLVNPVSTAARASGTSLPSTLVDTSIPGPSPTNDGGSGDGKGKEAGNGNEDDSEDDDAVQSFWDWLTGKVDELWDKITGAKVAPS